MKTLLKTIAISILFIAEGYCQNLYSSLADVNSRWTYEKDYPQFVHSASSEVNPIQKHLFLVHQTLSGRSTELLTNDQKESRARLLTSLKEYAQKAQFPNNLVYDERRPVFIGPNGNYCAVGHLIRESGHDDLARKISKKMNFHYLLDMKDDELQNWMVQSGFTGNELAWIQPGYLPSSVANKMDNGFNGPVHVILPDGNDIIAAGVFDSAGLGNAVGISRWVSGFGGFD